MKKIYYFVFGIITGFVLAHLANKNAKTKKIFDYINKINEEIVGAVSRGYNCRKNELEKNNK